MELAGISQSELARTLTKKLGREIQQSQIHMRIIHHNGRAPRDDEELRIWADALKLDGQHRESFMRLALFERTPPRIRAQLLRIEDENRRLERLLANTEKALDEVNGAIAKIAAENAENASLAANLTKQVERRL